jgi:sulfate transport system permease protein
VRTVEPILQDMEKELEEAAMSLGATRWQTFWQIIFPTILPSLLTGFAMAFARGLGEYGSVIFIAGNIPHVSQIVPLVIVIKLEEHNIPGATAIASVMLIASFILLFIINWLQQWTGSHSVERE